MWSGVHPPLPDAHREKDCSRVQQRYKEQRQGCIIGGRVRTFAHIKYTQRSNMDAATTIEPMRSRENLYVLNHP